MANLKFSQFTEQADPANVQFLVGYNGTDNVKIAPSNVADLSAYLPLAGGTMTGPLVMSSGVQLQFNDSNVHVRTVGDNRMYLKAATAFFFEISGYAGAWTNTGLGIKTTSPTRELDINGNIQLSDPTLSATRGLYGPGGSLITFNNLNFDTEIAGGAISQNPIFGTMNFKADQINDFLSHDASTGQTIFSFSGSETMRIDGATGYVGIGTPTPSYQLELSQDSAAKPTSSAWTVVSDERVKTNIRDYVSGLNELLQVKPKLFDYNGKAGFNSQLKNNIGVIAQEIKDIMPETIKTYNAKLNEEDEQDTELYNFDSHALTFALINAVKELSGKIEGLEIRIKQLENNG